MSTTRRALQTQSDISGFYVRRASDRGRARLSWLDSYHSFSFGAYVDQDHMGFGNLRVINEDTLAPGGGFATHGHSDMEIVSYVLEGEISHKDSIGNSYSIPAGDVQVMSAGTGVFHSEFNASANEHAHFLQIWLLPNKTGLEPSYDQKKVNNNAGLTPLVSQDGRNGTLKINQAASISVMRLEAGQMVELELEPDQLGYIHLIDGKLSLTSEAEDIELMAGDGVGFDLSTNARAVTPVHALCFEFAR